MKKSFYLLMGLIVSLFLVASCAPGSHFGVKDQAVGAPPQFDETEAAVAEAERSPGAKYCPEKIAKAKEVGKQGVETYWACRTAEAMKLLADARDLAKEAEGCQPPPPQPKEVPKPEPVVQPAPPPPLDSDGDGVPDDVDKCPNTPRGAKVDREGCWILPVTYFDTAKWNIRKGYFPALNEVATVLKNNPDVKVVIEGHTDNRGTGRYNKKLSDKRAKEVQSYLIKAGVSRERLNPRGYGETRPAVPNTSPENMAKNRRVDLVLVK